MHPLHSSGARMCLIHSPASQPASFTRQPRPRHSPPTPPCPVPAAMVPACSGAAAARYWRRPAAALSSPRCCRRRQGPPAHPPYPRLLRCHPLPIQWTPPQPSCDKHTHDGRRGAGLAFRRGGPRQSQAGLADRHCSLWPLPLPARGYLAGYPLGGAAEALAGCSVQTTGRGTQRTPPAAPRRRPRPGAGRGQGEGFGRVELGGSLADGRAGGSPPASCTGNRGYFPRGISLEKNTGG